MAREGAQTISLWPWRRGLASAGQQTSVPEDAMWQAKNCLAGLDGILSKRPGLRQWGQTLKAPDAGTGFFESFTDAALPGWVEADSSSGLVTWTATQGQLITNCVAGASNETLTLSNSTAIAADSYVRFMAQMTNLQAYDGSGTNADTFHFRIADSSSTGREFAVWSGGLYYKQASDNTYVLISGTEDLGAGKWSVIEIQVDDDGNTLVYMDETLVGTITSSAIAQPALARNDSALELAWEVDSGAQYTTKLVAVMHSTSALSAQTVEAVSGFRALVGAGSLQRTLLCAAGDYVYHDAGLLGVWRPIQRRTYNQLRFATYRKQMCWVETDGSASSKVWLWSGESTSAPAEQDEAPNCRFATEHQGRLLVAGDRENPLRVYFSADRQPNVWFAPGQNSISDRFDTQLDALYLEVPSRQGDEITAIFGDYYSNVLVFTTQGVYRITGSGLNSYAIQSVSQDVGCVSFEGVTQVGNDVWFVSREGVHTVSASDKFGDLIKGYASGPIQDRWGGDASAVEPINKTYIDSARLKYNSTLGLVYVAVPITTDTTAQRIFVYNTTTDEWYGPWDIDSQAMEYVEIASPVVEVMMHGGDAGQVLYTDELNKSDNGTAISMEIESALMSGRALDPSLVGKVKTWKRMRVYVLPRGKWDIKIFTRTDAGFYADEDANDPNQNKSTNVFDSYGLTDDWKIGADPDGRLVSREAMGYIEIRPELRGYSFAFKIVQDGDGEDVVIQGVEVDFVAHAHERD